MKITTSYIHPPVPSTSHDWMAYLDGDDGEGVYGLTGYGPTECEALRALAEAMAEFILERVPA